MSTAGELKSDEAEQQVMCRRSFPLGEEACHRDWSRCRSLESPMRKPLNVSCARLKRMKPRGERNRFLDASLARRRRTINVTVIRSLLFVKYLPHDGNDGRAE